MVFFLVFLVAGCAVVLPLLRRNTQARFWSAVMVLALIPAATVTALSKNLAFVALGAFGLVACFIGAMVCDPGGRPKVPALRLLSRTMCVLLLVAHVAGPSAGRMASVKITPLLFTGKDRLAGIGDTPGLDQQDMILINPPLQIATIWPAAKSCPGPSEPWSPVTPTSSRSGRTRTYSSFRHAPRTSLPAKTRVPFIWPTHIVFRFRVWHQLP